jgi:hypothetical protein
MVGRTPKTCFREYTVSLPEPVLQYKILWMKRLGVNPTNQGHPHSYGVKFRNWSGKNPE